MGAEVFTNKSFGKDAKSAFWRVVDAASYEHGHGGYTGTIAEKDSFVVVECPIDDVDAFIEAVDVYCYSKKCTIDSKHEAVVAKASKIFDDKWGPALCIPLKETDNDGNKAFIFCGNASS